MSYTRIKKLPSFEDIVRSTPLSADGYKLIENHRREIRDILAGRDDRLLIVVGPCSAWPEPAVLEYAKKLKLLSDKLADKLKIVMRLYIQKPRTVKGWTGPVNQPDPLLPPDIEEGIKYARGLMVKVCEMGLPIADEALFTHNSQGFLELLSWVAIGARSVEDQEHRIHASAIDCPVGMKNPTHGSLKIAINGILAAQHSHTAIFDGYEIKTDGNPYVHLVLRGGNGEPNYSLEHLEEARKVLLGAEITNPAIMVDASHDNCLINGKKDPIFQGDVVFNVLQSIQDRPELRALVKGFMLESFNLPGNQNIDTVSEINMGGLSITDPCLGFEQTVEVLTKLASVWDKK